MIGAVSGKILRNTKNPIIVMVGGVGYAVWVPLRTLSKIRSGEMNTFFTHTHVREDALDLYGFKTEEELELFELLLSVSGIGPRTGLSIVDRDVPLVTRAILQSDVDFFTTIPRLGKKNAQKIIIELKSKLGSVKELDLSEDSTGKTKQLLEALTSMGFDRKEALEAIKKLGPADVTIQQRIRKSLQYLGKR